MKIKDLKPADYNPRQISDEKLKMLNKSMQEYGDLSGIIFNRKTGNLIGGHMRIKNLDPEWEVVKKDAADNMGTVAEGYIETPFGRWVYREVNWPKKKEKAAVLCNIVLTAHKKFGGFILAKVGWKLKDIARFYGCKLSSIYSWNSAFWHVNKNRKMSVEVEAKAIEMLKQGAFYEDIAKAIGYSNHIIKERNAKEWKIPHAKIRANNIRIERTCLQCGKVFCVKKSKLKHDACNFCTHTCSVIYKTKPYMPKYNYYSGKKWNNYSRRVRRGTPTCEVCGGTAHLSVHHIIPRKISKDDTRENLLVLCGRHHKLIENLTRNLLEITQDMEEIKAIITGLVKKKDEKAILELVA